MLESHSGVSWPLIDATDRNGLDDEFRVSFREGAMGMTLSMDPDTRNAHVGKIVPHGQAYRAVRRSANTNFREWEFDSNFNSWCTLPLFHHRTRGFVPFFSLTGRIYILSSLGWR